MRQILARALAPTACFRRFNSTLIERELAKFQSRFDFPKATHKVWQLYKDKQIQEGIKAQERLPVVLHGWLDSAPRKVSKTRCFANLRDTQFLYRTALDRQGDLLADEEFTSIQLFEDLSEEDGEKTMLRRIKQETCVCVEGIVSPVKGDKSGRLEIVVNRITVLNTTEDLVSQMKGTKEWDPKYRYLQLRTFAMQRALAMRSKIASVVRSVFEHHAFTEVETPLLFRSTPEGAREFLVPTRTNEGKMYALPQSPQQYKQLLMASGVHRYYQFAKCFRDEDLRKDRQPEFTQIDLEMAFVKAAEVQVVVEDMLRTLWKKIEGVELDMPFKKLTYSECMSRYGIDKPDLRSDMAIIDLSSWATSTTNPDYPVFEILKYRPKSSKFPPAEAAPEGYATLRTPLSHRIRLTKEDRNAWLRRCVIRFDLQLQANVEDVAAEIMAKNDIKDGDVIYACTRQRVPFENPTPLGRQRLAIINSTMSFTETDVAPLWVVEFPLFTPAETGRVVDGYIEFDYNRLTSTHHPFTMPNLSSLGAVLHAANDGTSQVDPRVILGQHYDIVVNGVEVGGGSTRIHDASLQRFVLSRILRVPGVALEQGESEPNNPFTHLLNALSMGCPPHAGLALGFDRLCAMLFGSESIRDVIAFPKTQTGADPLVGSPSAVTPEQLDIYHLQLK
ncbi:tRNA synthetases class II-domain-containing protein [Lipomyces arxii]|uniref:tRNA synthetases class II-domain-containing protein n=1 Tax=Lipomyces arxii TaxID=56418 RepID=UPI0034CF5819